MPLESLPTFEIKFSKLSTSAQLLDDLFVDNEVQYRSCLTAKGEGGGKDFPAGWVALADDPGANINDRIQFPYFAVGVEASEIGSCRLIRLKIRFVRLRTEERPRSQPELSSTDL